MIRIEEIGIEVIEQFLLNDLPLAYQGLPDGELITLVNEGYYDPPGTARFLGIWNDDILICAAKWEHFTDVAVNIHPYLATPLQHQGVFLDIQDVITKWFLKYTKFVKMVVLTPRSCTKVHQAAINSGFILEGELVKAVLWREVIEDLLVYGKDLQSLREV